MNNPFSNNNSQNGQYPRVNMNNQNSTIQCNNGMDQYGNPCPQKSGILSYLPNWLTGSSGGRRRRTVRRGGGFRPYTDQNSASTASPFSGGRTAQPHQWTGGKRRRRRGTKRKRNCSKCNSRKRHRH